MRTSGIRGTSRPGAIAGLVTGVTAAELASGMTLKSVEGDTLRSSRMGAVYEVNNADIICGNIQTANATVYVINKVLMPMH